MYVWIVFKAFGMLVCIILTKLTIYTGMIEYNPQGIKSCFAIVVWFHIRPANPLYFISAITTPRMVSIGCGLSGIVLLSPFV